jgi:apolipoprotein N-acyltransferase
VRVVGVAIARSTDSGPGGTPARAAVRTLAAVAASGVALALYARVAWPSVLLGWVALVPWLGALDRTRSVGGAVAAGLLMCAAFALGVFWWFGRAIAAYTGAPLLQALLVLLLLAPFLEPQLLVFAVARHLLRRRGAGFWPTTVAAASLWVGTEWAAPKLLADTLGHGLWASTWMRQAADLGGAHALTFVLLVGNECARSALAAPRRLALGRVATAGVLAAALLAYGAVRCAALRIPRGSGTVTAAIVQADIDRYDRLAAERGTFDAVRAILDAHFALSASALRESRPDLLVWPETVYPTTFGAPKSPDGAAFDREIASFVARAGVPLVFGAYDAEGPDEFNAAVFLEPASHRTATFATYRKAALFPLTERVPALLESDRIRRWLPWLGTWRPGTGSEVVPVALADGRTIRVAPLICYDAVEPGLALGAVRRGADLIVTLSNDSWFGGGAGNRLHLVVSAFRSIETRRPQVRATNTGISALIDATGAVIATAGVHERAAVAAALVPDGTTTTLMLAWGNWFPPAALTCGLVLLAVPGLRRSRARSAPAYSRPARGASAPGRAGTRG